MFHGLLKDHGIINEPIIVSWEMNYTNWLNLHHDLNPSFTLNFMGCKQQLEFPEIFLYWMNKLPCYQRSISVTSLRFHLPMNILMDPSPKGHHDVKQFISVQFLLTGTLQRKSAQIAASRIHIGGVG